MNRPPHRRARALLAVATIAAVAAALSPAGASTRLYEKVPNLDIALRVRDRLAHEGVVVVMTRSSDQTMSLSQRTALANARDVDVYVAIHNNAGSSSAVRTEIYRQVASGASGRLGADLRDAFAKEFSGRKIVLGARRGSGGDDYYYVLRTTDMPAVIVEGAYVSNRKEAALLATAGFRQSIADAIANGILDYQRSLVGSPAPDLDPGTRAEVPALPAPTDGVALAVNARTIDLSWQTDAGVPSYRVYRDGRLIAEVPNPSADPLAAAGRIEFVDRWGAPGQQYAYEIRGTVKTDALTAESAPLAMSARTPPIAVALDPGHGGSDPGAIGSY